MDITYINQLFDYNYWAHRKVWDCVMQLSEEQFKEELDYSRGSIWMQVLHTAGVEMWWFHFLNTGELKFVSNVEDYSTREAIRAKWDEVEQDVRAYLARLTPQELEREVRPDFWDDDQKPVKVWQAIMQVFNHSTDHRAQTLAGLHRLGAPTVGQDILDYLFEKQKSS